MKKVYTIKLIHLIVFICLFALSCSKSGEEANVIPQNDKSLNFAKKSNSKDLLNELINDDDFKEYLSIRIINRSSLEKNKLKEAIDFVVLSNKDPKEFSRDLSKANKMLGFSYNNVFKAKEENLFKKVITKYKHRYDLGMLTNYNTIKSVSNVMLTKIVKPKLVDGISTNKLPCDDIFLSYELMAQQDKVITMWTFKTAVFVLGAYEGAAYAIEQFGAQYGAAAAGALGGIYSYLDNVLGINPIDRVIDLAADYLGNISYAYTTNLGFRMMCECYEHQGVPCDYQPV